MDKNTDDVRRKRSPERDLDAMDRKLLGVLVEDATTSYGELGERVGRIRFVGLGGLAKGGDHESRHSLLNADLQRSLVGDQRMRLGIADGEPCAALFIDLDRVDHESVAVDLRLHHAPTGLQLAQPLKGVGGAGHQRARLDSGRRKEVPHVRGDRR